MITFGTLAVWTLGMFCGLISASPPKSTLLGYIGAVLVIFALVNFVAMAVGFYS